MYEENFYDYIQKQILLLIGWSLLTGFGFTVLCMVYDIVLMALIWYGLMIITSIWGWILYSRFRYRRSDIRQLEPWYRSVKLFMYSIFSLWTLLFILYSNSIESNVHLVTLFTQITASVIASTFLFSDKKIFVPILLILIYPLVIYFINIEEGYGYFLSIFSILFLALLLYASNNGHQLIHQINYEAHHDSLTGLYNRRYFVDYVEQLLYSLRDSYNVAYLLLIDLDHFKTINDSLGHDVGDVLLRSVAQRIEKYSSKSHLISRIGGDEFMIVSRKFEDREICMTEAKEFAKGLGQILKETYLVEYNHLHISASIGINIIDYKSENCSQLIKETDIAMYEAKAGGRDDVVHFNTLLADQVDSNLKIERKLYFALQRNEIELYYQAQLNNKEEIIGCEVLARWFNDELGYVSPIEFIMVAEKTGIIIELGNYIMEESFKTLKKWTEMGFELEQFSINISVRQLLNESFFYHVEHLCKSYLTRPMRKKVIFEITETLLVEDSHKVIKYINNLKKLGIRFSMDDFGTGYSSLSYLRELPLDELKIDRAFISRLGECDSDDMMVETIFSLAKIFNLKIVAEGVETGEQYRLLIAYGCSIFQGYYFAKPIEMEDFELLLRRNRMKKKEMISI